MNQIKNKVAVVLVTFNRLDKLKIALDCYEKQNIELAELIVVDNHSTDGTVQFLKDWEKRIGRFRRNVLYLDGVNLLSVGKR